MKKITLYVVLAVLLQSILSIDTELCCNQQTLCFSFEYFLKVLLVK